MAYDLKNEIEDLISENSDKLDFPEAYFYVPTYLFFIHENSFEIASKDREPDEIYGELLRMPTQEQEPNQTLFRKPLQNRTSKEKYLSSLEKLKNHILEGDMYEINYCMEFFSEDAHINPREVYLALNELSPMPFSAYLKIPPNKYAICASPERFLKKKGSQLISQPIKGTAKRGENIEADTLLISQLRNSEKEQAENMMIVDLVRNDLARSSRTGSVAVQEMFGIYTFPALHQMISTVISEKKPEIPLTEVIKNAFPMGSMTGAPKIKAMQIIENEEVSKRSLYSGAIGYFTSEGDFDFNVVIRSILYNAWKHHVSFQVGSAITFDAEAEKEYEECLLKAKTMEQVLLEITDYRPFYKNKKKRPAWQAEVFKMLVSLVFYTFFMNWFEQGILNFNTHTGIISGFVALALLMLYIGFKKIQYWQSRPLNILHNWVAHLLNAPAGILFVIGAYIFMFFAAIVGFFVGIYRIFKPEEDKFADINKSWGDISDEELQKMYQVLMEEEAKRKKV
ncbi:MAG: anthranilate synthase component I family protein [Verrucomicrobia bacterium]|nr:anthranilate synthase component I family protein [Cytophagales bacterium]